MATFKGSIQEFHHFIGPRIRNVINNHTRKIRNDKNGICEFCHKNSELQSAHVHGRDRRTIIESVLNNYIDIEGTVLCSIKDAELEIIKAHKPINDTFKFICHRCHVEYDSSPMLTDIDKKKSKTQKPNDTEYRKLYKIELWSKKPNQINHKIIVAFLELEKVGLVNISQLKKHCTEKLGIRTFNSNFAQMKNDNSNSHGKVFYVERTIVKIWEKPRSKINKYFP